MSCFEKLDIFYFLNFYIFIIFLKIKLYFGYG